MNLRRRRGHDTAEPRPRRGRGRRIIVFGTTLAISAAALAATAAGASALPNTDQCQAYDSALAWDLGQADYWDTVAYLDGQPAILEQHDDRSTQRRHVAGPLLLSYLAGDRGRMLIEISSPDRHPAAAPHIDSSAS